MFFRISLIARSKGPAARTPLPEHLKEQLKQLAEAQHKFSKLKQPQVNAIFREAALRASSERLPLAQFAVKETGMGIVEDKVIKNHFSAENVFHKYKDLRTCGVIEEDVHGGFSKVATPVGPILGIIPVTNPSSTTIFKALLSLKTRNCILFAAHPRAIETTTKTANILRDAAISAGAPEGCIQVIETPSIDLVHEVMRDENIKFILATGGNKLVKACYSSGKPTIGVGAGNASAVVDETANVRQAVSSILMSKEFDNGVICATEQSVVVVNEVKDKVIAEFKKRGAAIVSDPEDIKKLEHFMWPSDGKEGPHLCSINPNAVGQKAVKIAKMAGISIPDSAQVIIADMTNIPFDIERPMSGEKLSPVLSLYCADDFHHAIRIGANLVEFYGAGHTSILHTNENNHDRIREFELIAPSCRVLVDTPATFGAIGDVYNWMLDPALTLGCGTIGGNSFAGNLGPMNLVNIKSVAERKENMQWIKLPPRIYYKSDIIEEALKDLVMKGSKKALIVTDKAMHSIGILDRVQSELNKLGIHHDTFDQVQIDPNSDCIEAGVKAAEAAQPDVIIGLGGGSPMDACKIIRLLYEHPEMKLKDCFVRFMDIRKRIVELPYLGSKVHTVVCIPTTSGTGAEITPFAVITDAKTGKKMPIASFKLTPDIAVVDGSLAHTMPKKLAAYTGIDALVHAIESHISILATPVTKPIAAEAARLLFAHLPRSVINKDRHETELVHTASMMAGMSFSNAFLGICHSMAHALGSQFHIAHGLANAYAIVAVIRFNANRAPTRRTPFSQYKYYQAIESYADIADKCGLTKVGMSDEDKVEALIVRIQELKKEVGCPFSIEEGENIDREEYEKVIDSLAEAAFDDQCTGSNPRYPLISELKTLFREVFEGDKATRQIWIDSPEVIPSTRMNN
eukprot:Nk52_evm51s2152 gene=Nk52_evmTU51s2152